MHVAPHSPAARRGGEGTTYQSSIGERRGRAALRYIVDRSCRALGPGRGGQARSRVGVSSKLARALASSRRRASPHRDRAVGRRYGQSQEGESPRLGRCLPHRACSYEIVLQETDPNAATGLSCYRRAKSVRPATIGHPARSCKPGLQSLHSHFAARSRTLRRREVGASRAGRSGADEITTFSGQCVRCEPAAGVLG